MATATGYALDGTLASGRREYTLRLSLRLTDNPAPAQAFQNGQTFAPVLAAFVSYDTRQLEAADSLGLPTASPR